jgi:hypothetical protein
MYAPARCTKARPDARACLFMCREEPCQAGTSTRAGLYDSTDGLQQQWRMLEELDPTTTDAVIYAITRGWALVEDGTCICLTDAGRRLVKHGDPERWRPIADLEHILRLLHDSGINAGVQTFYDAGMRVWIGDEINGIRVEAAINRTPAARLKWPEGLTAANWLHETALHLYPDSKYAKDSAPTA